MSDVPVVFISYSHDSPDHKRWVGELGTKLREGGVEVILDQWDLRLGDDLTLFMERGVKGSDRVIVVCTDEFVRKAEAGEGGVGYERMIVTGELVRDIGRNKFIPIVRESTGDSPVPSFLSTKLYKDFREDSSFEAALEDLLREVHDAPKNPKPPLGENPFAEEKAASARIITLPSEFSDLKALYDKLTALARSDDLLGWRQVVKGLRPAIDQSLSDWRERYQGQPLNDVDALHRAVDEAVASLGPVLLIALVGVESANPRFSDQRSLMDDLVNAPTWDHSGVVVVADLPLTLGYVYHALHGAMCMSSRQLGLALDLAQMKFRRPFESDSQAVWKTSQLTGWPKSLGGKATDAWRFLATATTRWTWLTYPFGDEQHFRVALSAYYMALNVLELAELLASGGGPKLKVKSNRFHLEVPLTLESEQQQTREKAFRLLLNQGESLAQIWERLNVSRADMEAHWPEWLQVGLGWVHKVVRFGPGPLSHERLFSDT